MKKNLRLLCLGLAAATFTCSFAQEPQDMTYKLTNADMEQGLTGWAIDGEKLMGKNTKNPATQTGFYGMSKGVLEAWNGNGKGLADSYIMQRLSGLPNGTYVFGAYVGASKQYHRKPVTVEVDGKEVTKYEYWSNRDSVQGVQLFANDAVVRVATNNPDYNNMVCADGSLYTDGHAAKFNVAVTLTADDKKPGYMDAGLRYSGTNANYVVWDNATLYFFGDMSEADALDAMAKIDVKNAVAIADTLKKEVMNVDTLDALTKVLADAEAAVVTAANLEEVSNPIFRTAGLARKSATDYANLKKNIESAKVVAAGEWSEDNADYVALLNEVIATAEGAYEEKVMNRAELTALRKELNWTAGDVKLDSLFEVQNVLGAFINEARKVEGLVGGYTKMQIASLEDLAAELADTLGVVDADCWDEDGNAKPMEDRTVNPNNVYSYLARVYTAIENVKNNTISAEYTKMPIEFKTAENGWIENAEWLDESKKLVAYTSPLYRFQGKVETFRITVKKNKNGAAHFCLSGLKFWDGDGNLIPLTEENLSTAYDHNTINPNAPDGGGIAALFDEDNNSYFHSAWQNSPAGHHYLDVVLPNGGYDAFSFQMISRSNSNGWDQSHTFPGEMILSTPMPQRDALEQQLAKAKALNAYSVPEPGFYEANFDYLLDAIAEVEAALEGYPAESECKTMSDNLKQIIAQFEGDENKGIRLPESGKVYRIISGVPGFYNNQSLEKAITVNAADSTLWWESVCADSLQQQFLFEPILEDGEICIKTEEGEENGVAWVENYYCYTVKNVKSGLYIDSAFVGGDLRVVKEATDTVLLKSLGRGQWNIIVKGEMLHAGDHYSGVASSSAGAYGGVYGIGSGICAYPTGIDGASAWFIREMPALPLKVEASGETFKSECIHFASANTITLTADKDCAFADLALYDLYGNAIAIDSLVVSGKTATITAVAKNLVACAFEFTNAEGVSSVEFDAFQYFSSITLLQEAYDEAVAVAPEQGTEVGQYADITEYTAAIEAAEAMLDGGASNEEMEAMIERLEAAVEGLEVNLPEAGKYYFIYSALEAFEKNKGYKMAMYTDASELRWGNENYTDWTRYWQFVPATVQDLKNAGADTTLCAYYIKNVANELFVADGAQSSTVSMASDTRAAVPYVVNVLGVGTEVSLDGLGLSGKRIHANGHSNGAGNGSNIVYWNAGAGTASAWRIVEAQYDVTDIDFTEVENDAKVSAKGTFDLFGRRIVAPTAPGIYIIDGKKKYVK